MTLDHKQLQKKKEKNAGKRKAKKKEQPKSDALIGVTSKMAMINALKAPIYECFDSEELFGVSGIGSVIVTRKTSENIILMAAFLVDVYCLGVKDTDIRLISEREYSYRLEMMEKYETFRQTHPACAKKLVEGAAAYAKELGFNPHHDYLSAKAILDGIDTTLCERSFTYGREGKPFYMSGPHDSVSFRKHVYNTLMDKCGPDGFEFTMHLGDSEELLE